MYHFILVPLDGSQFAEEALPLSMAIAARAEARLEIVQVFASCPPLCLAYNVVPYYDPLQDAAYEEQDRGYLAAIVSRLRKKGSVPMSSALVGGTIVEGILERARSTDADLIVMTTHGRGPLSRFWLGSVADGLLRQARLPVLMLHPSEHSEPNREPGLRHILIPLDGSELAEGALEHAIALGSLMGAEYTLLRAVAPRLVPDGYPVAAGLTTVARGQLEKRASEATAYLDAVAERMRSKSLRVQTNVVVAESAAVAILTAACQGIDLIAIATHGRGGLKRLLLGSVADKVIRGTFVPVLVFRPVTP